MLRDARSGSFSFKDENAGLMAVSAPEAPKGPQSSAEAAKACFSKHLISSRFERNDNYFAQTPF